MQNRLHQHWQNQCHMHGYACRPHCDDDRAILACSDDCKINNGGCDINAECSHNATTNAVICTCKVGYTNTAPEGTKTVCTGQSTACPQTSVMLQCIRVLSDSCLVNNGGCDVNAICSHNSSNNAAQCTCKTGYTNTGSSSNVICTGKRCCATGRRQVSSRFFAVIADSCLVSNGGCDANAICSHDNKTFDVVCTCKTGYTNTGSAPSVVCTGQITVLSLSSP